ncbi:PilN domain-containing protein [Clostridium chromiireducens]|uniref:Fimbrial assembly protein PilN n=1 Tax=Clostridium chromiireducens TaxID=225345 RepID=A0A1V4IJZ1_9CLOT|nr:PilN domain-containing protein [Clostridium chromiireducens]OPJ60065.1 fimbrial assembly protein PilN [Clostridium chromiireducens]
MRDINFFSYYQGKNQEKKDEKIYFYIAYGILTLVILITVIINSIKILTLNNQIKSYTEKLNAADIQAQLKEADEVNGKIETLSKYESSLSEVSNSIAKNDIVTDDLLNDISSTIPSNVSFKSFKIEGYDLTISGVSHDREAVSEFEHNLKGLSEIKSVHVININNSNAVGEDYSFDMTCVLKEVK